MNICRGLCNYMTCGSKSSSPNPIVPLGNEGNIKVEKHFKYLGAFYSADGTNIKELNNRIGKAARAFRELDKVWRMKFYNSCVLSTLLYITIGSPRDFTSGPQTHEKNMEECHLEGPQKSGQ